ncbi:MAG: MFS transporter [Gammaproteobacteria bacterium]|nr:MFS transporter [Gammaproteobacteria bacterium]
MQFVSKQFVFTNYHLKNRSSIFSSSYYPWLIVILCSAFAFYKFVLQVSPSVMTSDLMRVFHVNGAGLGNLAATYFYAYLIAQLFAGPLLDRYSPRLITGMAISICALGTMIFANTKILLIAELARTLIGVGAAFATVSYMKMTSLWFRPNQMALVDGLLATGAMTGALCGQIPLAYLVANQGWQQSLIDCSLAGVVLASLFFLIVRDKNKTTVDSVRTKDSNPVIKIKEFLILLKKRENWMLAFYSGLAFTPVAVLGGLWGNPFFIEAYHLNLTQAASFTSCIFLGLALGAPVFGFFADKLGRIRVMKLGTAIALISLMIVLFISNLPLWWLGCVLFVFGFGTGAFMSCFALGKEMNGFRLTATIVSLINTGDALLGSFTEPLVGKILDYTWTGQMVNGLHHFTEGNFRCAFSILPLYMLGALICLYMIKNNNEEKLC